MHLYGVYADRFLGGDLPYRDFFAEYPPGAFAIFLPPAVLPSGAYNFAFKSLMALCGLAALFAVVLVLLTLGVRGRRLYAAAALFALSPLAVGPISLNTYDLFPAALTVGALAALLRKRALLAFGLLGLAVSAKLYPLVLVPPAAAYVWVVAGRRRALQSLLVLSAVVAVVLVPFAVLAPGVSGTAFTRSPHVGCRSRAWAVPSCSLLTGSGCMRRRSSEARPEPRRVTFPARLRTRLPRPCPCSRSQ